MDTEPENFGSNTHEHTEPENFGPRLHEPMLNQHIKQINNALADKLLEPKVISLAINDHNKSYTILNPPIYNTDAYLNSFIAVKRTSQQKSTSTDHTESFTFRKRTTTSRDDEVETEVAAKKPRARGAKNKKNAKGKEKEL